MTGKVPTGACDRPPEVFAWTAYLRERRARPPWQGLTARDAAGCHPLTRVPGMSQNGALVTRTPTPAWGEGTTADVRELGGPRPRMRPVGTTSGLLSGFPALIAPVRGCRSARAPVANRLNRGRGGWGAVRLPRARRPEGFHSRDRGAPGSLRHIPHPACRSRTRHNLAGAGAGSQGCRCTCK